MPELVLGVDAGGTKTIAVVADRAGQVHGVGRGGSANFQSCGVHGAAGQIRRAVFGACEQAAIEPAGFEAVCYGVSGADREQDFATIRSFLEPIAPCEPTRLENDTIVALRAGTPDGVGLALIAGTGANAIGRTAQGQRHQVGGLGRLTGDYGSAGQLAEAAVIAAFKGLDGRGPQTVLSHLIPDGLGIDQLHDIIEFEFYDRLRSPLDLGSLAPLVFEAAASGDAVSRGILTQAGKEIARAVEVILERLFDGGVPVTVVFGGSVFMHGVSPILIDTVKAEIRRAWPAVQFVRLDAEPVLGAVGFAFDDLGWAASVPIWDTLRKTYEEATAD